MDMNTLQSMGMLTNPAFVASFRNLVSKSAPLEIVNGTFMSDLQTKRCRLSKQKPLLLLLQPLKATMNKQETQKSFQWVSHRPAGGINRLLVKA